jgi:uncharacterized protein DUF4105
MRRLLTTSLRVVLTALVVAVVAWSVAAIWIDGPKNRELAGMLCVVVGAGSLLLLLVVQPWWWSLMTAVVPFVVVLAWWLSNAPSNERDWQSDVARLPSATIAGDRVTIRNVRNFAYPSAASAVERWETRTYDLSRIDGFDMFLSYWGPTIIAHTISSWEFSDGQHLAISIETRKKNGQDYSPVLGFFRQYELYYVVADERDVIGVRTGPRQETMQLYRLRGGPAFARALLLDYLDEINQLAREPQWYNALTHNCTTTIRHHVAQIAPGNPFDWRILANGHLDQLGYERRQINTSLPFSELRRRSDITARARSAANSGDFSRVIREGLPARPAPDQGARPSVRIDSTGIK